MKEPVIIKGSVKVYRPKTLYRPHPGSVFARRCLKTSQLNQQQIATLLGISKTYVSMFLDGLFPVDGQLAKRLAECTDISEQAWLHYQSQRYLYDGQETE